MNKEKPFLLSYQHREKIYYKLVYALNKSIAKSLLEKQLDKELLECYGWKNVNHNIHDCTILPNPKTP